MCDKCILTTFFTLLLWVNLFSIKSQINGILKEFRTYTFLMCYQKFLEVLFKATDIYKINKMYYLNKRLTPTYAQAGKEQRLELKFMDKRCFKFHINNSGKKIFFIMIRKKIY